MTAKSKIKLMKHWDKHNSCASVKLMTVIVSCFCGICAVASPHWLPHTHINMCADFMGQEEEVTLNASTGKLHEVIICSVCDLITRYFYILTFEFTLEHNPSPKLVSSLNGDHIDLRKKVPLKLFTDSCICTLCLSQECVSLSQVESFLNNEWPLFVAGCLLICCSKLKSVVTSLGLIRIEL